MENFLPEEFKAIIGGMIGLSYSVEKDGDALIYKVLGEGYSRNTSLKIKPTQEGWRLFWERMDRAGVWQWKRHYGDPKHRNGTNWKLCIAFGDRRADASGKNAFPDKFHLFLRSVSELLGGVSFN